MEAVNGVPEGDKGGPPPPSPLTGCYLLIVIGEPHCNEHKDIILQRVAKGLLSWDVNDCLVDLEKELAIITEQALEGEEARYGERLIQFASENLVTEILIHPVVSTLAQCIRNLLSSFTRHRHIIHAGYTFAHNGSWILQDGTFSCVDFSEAFQEIEVLRVIRAYENGISLDIHCAPEGDWVRLSKESFTRGCKVRVNPNDVLTAGSPAISSFINYLEPFLIPADLESVLESSDVVGNIRFSRPTLYVFPGGQGDAALFGINGFNMLLDGGFSRKACFWDFVRHLDRLDAVLLTRLNNNNVNGISGILRRKMQNALYPQIGHFFCNIQERKAILSPDGDKDKDPLLINLLDQGQEIISNLRHLNLTPQVCYRDSEPINLYHKVGHGTLDMYVLSPAKESKEVREFLLKWNNNDQKLFANQKTNKEFVFPLQNLVSICALLVWQPANPEDTITRILFPGSSTQSKIFDGLDKVKNLEFIKHPVCSEKSLAPTTLTKAKQSLLDRIIQPEKKTPIDNKKERLEKAQRSPNTTEIEAKNGEINGLQTSEKVKKSDSTESEKSISKQKKIVENGEQKEKLKTKPKSETKAKPRSESQQRKVKGADKKPSPTTPKKQVEKTNEEQLKGKIKASPTSTPAKSAKEANNRKVVESKIKAAPKKAPEKKELKTERKPISRRPKDISKLSGSPSKKVNGVQKPDAMSRRSKLDKEGTTDSSTVSTPSADQDSILKKDISKLTSDELQNLKAQELADLKEEQEAVKEIEAVFRKGERQDDKPSDFRKVKDLSIEDKLESEEYLIIEKTEIDQELINETNQEEEETQKIARDSEESEKQRKLSEEKEIEEKRTELQNEIQKIIPSANDIVKAKEETIEASKEISITSPEDKIDVSTDKKDNENEIKETAQESQPDEKGSANIESGATTTAPTLPEDERMPLDEIKEDNGDQIIEEKHVKEDTKEKDVPVIQLPPKAVENIAKLPPVVGIRLDKQSHIRDIVKTPDEVADLPVHEEVEFDHYEDYPSATEVKSEIDEPRESDTGKAKVVDDKEKEQVKEVDLAAEGKIEVEEEKTEGQLKEEDKPTSRQDEKIEKAAESVVAEDSSKKEFTKLPDEEKDKNEHELDSGPGVTKGFEVTTKEENIVQITSADTTEKQIDIKDGEVSVENEKETEQYDKKKDTTEDQLKTEEVVEKSETEVKEKEDSPLKEKQTLTQSVPELTEDNVRPKSEDKIIEKGDKEKLKADASTISKIDEKLQKLKDDSNETVDTASKQVVTETVHPEKQPLKIKEDVDRIEKIDEKLQKLKEEIKTIEKVVTHQTEGPQHAESVVISSDSPLESPVGDDKKIGDKVALGQKSPKEREEDVAKIVASVAEVLKSDAPLEEFEGKIPFSVPYTSYTTELRETHITTVDSPLTEENKTITSDSSYFIEQERKIAPIHEEQEVADNKITKMIKDSNELMQASSRIIQDIKQSRQDTEPTKEDQDGDSGTVHRMLVTASSEDGGEETEICPAGTITFSKSSESSGRSSPDLQSQKISQKSSVTDTFSDNTVLTKSALPTIQNVAEGLVQESQSATDKNTDQLKDIKEVSNVLANEETKSADIIKDKQEIIASKENEDMEGDIPKIQKNDIMTDVKTMGDKSTTVKESIDSRDVTQEKSIIKDLEKPEEETPKISNGLDKIFTEGAEEESFKQSESSIKLDEIKDDSITKSKDDSDFKKIETNEKKTPESDKKTAEIDGKVETSKEKITLAKKEETKESITTAGTVKQEHDKLEEIKQTQIEDSKTVEKTSPECVIFEENKESTLTDDKVSLEVTNTAPKEVEIISEVTTTEKTDAKNKEQTIKESIIADKVEEPATTTKISEEYKTPGDEIERLEEVQQEVRESKLTTEKTTEDIVVLPKQQSENESDVKHVESLPKKEEKTIEEIKETEKINAAIKIEEEAEQKRGLLQEIVSDVSSATLDTTELIETAQAEIQKIKDSTKSITEDIQKALTTTTETVTDAMKNIVEDNAFVTKDEIEEIKENIETKIGETKSEITAIEANLVENVKDILKEDFKIIKTDIDNGKECIDDSYNSFKESLIKQKDTISGIVTDIEKSITDAIKPPIEDIKRQVEDAKHYVEETCEEVSDLIVDKTIDLQEKDGYIFDKACGIIDENKKIINEGKDKLAEKASAEIKETESKTEAIIEELKTKEGEIKQKITDEKQKVEEYVEEKKEEVLNKFDNLRKDLTKVENDFSKTIENVISDVSQEQKLESSKSANDKEEMRECNLQNGLEGVEKMVVDVLTADRITPDIPEKEETSVIKKVEKEVENILEKGVADVKEFVEEAKDSITSVFKHDSDKEKILEKAAEDIEKNYEMISDMSKSVVFEKCHVDEHKQQEEFLEKTAEGIEKDYETVTNMSKSIIFEKCEPALQEKLTANIGADLDKNLEPRETVTDSSKPVTKKEIELTATPSMTIEESLKQLNEDVTTKPPASDVELTIPTQDLSDTEKKLTETSHQDLLLFDATKDPLDKASPLLSRSSPPLKKEEKKDLPSVKALDEDIKHERGESLLSGLSSDTKFLEEEKQIDEEDVSKKLSTSESGHHKEATSSETSASQEKPEEPVGKDTEKCVNQQFSAKMLGSTVQTEEAIKKSLEIECKDEKKLSISDVQISVEFPETEKLPSDLSELRGCSDEAEANVESVRAEQEAKKTEEIETSMGTKETQPKTSEAKEDCKAGPSTTPRDVSLSPAKSSSEDLHLSGKSTPDIAEVEKLREMQETLKHEKHIVGSSTPPTVPVSPIIKEIPSTQSEDAKASTVKSSIAASVRDSEIRSSTPGSDDYEIGASTHSDISSGQASRAPHLLESERIESDEDDDVPGSPMSITSQVAHSRSSSRYDFDDERLGTKADPMNTSFYGALPDDEDPEPNFEMAVVEHREARGENLVAEKKESASYLYEITKAKYSSPADAENVSGQARLDRINKNGRDDVMTASFMGETLPPGAQRDALDSWGKPLGLPSPAPPNDNRGTPKKEKKLPLNVSAKNKLNDDKKRADSPSKYKNRKFSPVYVDLTYVPHHGNSYYSYVDFFKRIRARYYVFSGIEPSREVYNALLEAKQSWEDKELEVTIIPTYDTDILGYWVAENEELLTKYKIDLSPSASRCTINLQDHETSCSAYRLEF